MNYSSTQPAMPNRSALKSLMPWIVWGLSCIFYFYECLLQVSPSVMSSELMRDFAVTSQTLGILSGIYFYSYAAMQLPGGVLMDYFGPQRLLTIATIIYSETMKNLTHCDLTSGKLNTLTIIYQCRSSLP